MKSAIIYNIKLKVTSPSISMPIILKEKVNFHIVRRMNQNRPLNSSCITQPLVRQYDRL